MLQTTMAKSTDWVEGYSLTRRAVARVRFHPAPVDSGVVFHDTRGGLMVSCLAEHAQLSNRWTSLGVDAEHVIHHTEHILAAVSFCSVDNVLIDVDGLEIPLVTNGSSRAFVDAIRSAGITEQQSPRKVYRLKQAFAVTGDGDASRSVLLGYPSNVFSLSYMFHVPLFADSMPVVESCEFAPPGVREDIINARTYLLEHEVEAFGVLLNEKVSDMLVVGPGRGTHTYGEAARHKLLDMVGDLRCLGLPLLGHFVGVRSGHKLNLAAVRHMARAGVVEVCAV